MSNTVYAAETWSAVYDAYQSTTFASYDMESIRQALIDRIRVKYPEHFNDFIISSELMIIIESFAIVAEMLAYRADMNMHENSNDDAQRKQSVLRLAKYIAYNATRNKPARGLVKLSSVVTSEQIFDSNGINLANRTIKWADKTNANWREQFFMVIDRVLKKSFGRPNKAFTIDGSNIQLYELNNTDSYFQNGTFAYTVRTNSDTYPFELVCADIDSDSVFERDVDGTSRMQVLYTDDGLGVNSPRTGFMFLTKQGSLTKQNYTFDDQIPNRIVDVDAQNINHDDVWLNQVDNRGLVTKKWSPVDMVGGQNIYFNLSRIRTKFEVETRENDAIRVIFGDGEFSDIPHGSFHLWYRTSANKKFIVETNKIQNELATFQYKTKLDEVETCTLTFSLTETIQNSTESENIEHIRKNAPKTYYAQNRMVNGQDYNTLPLRESSILKLLAVNRTFIGQPKHIDWNEASGNYQNVKVFGDDARIYLHQGQDTLISRISTRRMIDEVLEPIISKSGVQNAIMFQMALDSRLDGVRYIPRRTFVERAGIGRQEKTLIQGFLDSHYYGEPSGYTTVDGRVYANVTADTDYEIWDTTSPRMVDGIIWKSGVSSGLQPVASLPEFGIRYEPVADFYGDGGMQSVVNHTGETWTVECIVDTSNGVNSSGVTFAVTGSVSGVRNAAYVGVYTDESVAFRILPTSGREYTVGDAFVIRPDGTVEQFNIHGSWDIISGVNLNKTGAFDITTAGLVGANRDASWIMWCKANVDVDGNVVDYSVTWRDIKLVIESDTTKFWFNSQTPIVDSDTKTVVRDTVQILKSNLGKTGQFAIGKNLKFEVIGNITNDDGIIAPSKIEVYQTGNSLERLPSELRRDAPNLFVDFVNVRAPYDYVYFRVKTDGTRVPVAATTDIVGRNWNTNFGLSTDGLYERMIGRDGLDFMWQHFSPNTNVIDPTITNINDIYVLTQGYYESYMEWVAGGGVGDEPQPPSSAELRNTYRNVIATKMMSDTVVVQSGKIKLLFGNLASPSLRGRFRILRAASATMSNDEIKNDIVRLVNQYFTITDWDFGTKFFFTDLAAKLHNGLVGQIASVVVVPTFASNSFGSLFVVESGQDEVLQSALTVDDIDVVDGYTPDILRSGTY